MLNCYSKYFYIFVDVLRFKIHR